MSSTSMPPPPSPLAHRRNRLNTNFNPTESSSCASRKMSLLKGATFHSSSSAASDADPVLSIQYLTRRSPTCSHASLSSLLSEKRGLAAHAIADFEETFSGARGPNHTSRRRSAETFNQQLKEVRAALPTDEGLGSSVSSPSEKGISKSLARVELDSGLGDSIDGSVIVDGVYAQHTSEKDSPVTRNLIQETDSTDNTKVQTRQQGRNLRLRTTSTTKPRSADTQISSAQEAQHPPLSKPGKKKVFETLLTPLVKDERFKDFHPLVKQLGSRVNRNIRCLRDLERSLIFQPVTQLPRVTPRLYQSFGELTIQLVVNTYNHLSETEQRRSTDRPYSNGYFLDLVQQVSQLAAHIGSSSGTQGEDSEEVFSIEDEVTLEGGLGSTGDFAELVRWKNGKGISLRTGLPYEPMAGLKRQHSTMTEEEIMRSMARRKKGYIPEYIEMKCSDPDCDKVFTRKCDLSKHEKTHSRPFKCPHKTCKYHELGLPTEKERDRHMNDKHDPNPRLYPCMFCEFKTKRESNCKQHMEKKHNWEYKRAKGKDKDSGSTPAQTPLTQNMEYVPSNVQPSPAQSNYNFDDHSSMSGSIIDSAHGSTFTPLDEPFTTFDLPQGFQSMPLFPRQPPQGTQYVQASTDFGFEVPNPTSGYDQFNGYISPVKTTPDSSNVRLTPATPAYSTFTPIDQSPYVEHMNTAFGTGMNNNNNVFWQDGLPTPESAVYNYSRHPSVQYESPNGMGNTLGTNPLLGQDITLPLDDFALNFNAFSNPDAAHQTLFSGKDLASQQFDTSAFENVDFTNMEDLEMDDFEDIVNYNGN